MLLLSGRVVVVLGVEDGFADWFCVCADGAVDYQGDGRYAAAAAVEDDAGADGQGGVDGAGEVFAAAAVGDGYFGLV